MATERRRRRERDEPRPLEGMVPVHDLDAEAAVLSTLLMGEAADTIFDLLEHEDFYSDANGIIFEAAASLWAAGKPIDLVSVARYLRGHERIEEAGGTGYLGQLVDKTPAVANITHHCQIVSEHRRQRRIVTVARDYLAEGYRPVEDVTAWADAFEADIHAVTMSGASWKRAGLEPLKEVLAEAFVAMKDRAEGQGRVAGIPTRYVDLDKKTAGLHHGDVMIVGARPGMGKAQPHRSKVLTPTGWRTIGSLQVGDMAISAATGLPTKVVGVFEQGERDIYRVTMVDGSSTECCDEHLWLTSTRKERRQRRGLSVKSLADIRETMRRKDGGRSHAVPYAQPAHFDPLTERLPIDPYLLGVWLGDGGRTSSSVMIHNPETDIRARIAELLPPTDCMVEVDGIAVRVRTTSNSMQRSTMRLTLEELGLHDCHAWEKFIPEMYLRASVEDRVRLLQGMCDTDGYVAMPRLVEYTTTSPRLAHAIEFLVGSLGGVCTWSQKEPAYTHNGKKRAGRTAFRMLIRFPTGNVCPVSSEKHLRHWKPGPGRITHRFMDTVEYVRREECRCIAIDDPSHLYVTDGFIVTHNTSLVLNIATNVAAPSTDVVATDQFQTEEVERAGVGVAVFSLEMPREQNAVRMICIEARVDLGKLRQGYLSQTDWANLTAAATTLAHLPIWIDDTPGLTVLALRGKVRRLQSELEQQRRTNPDLPELEVVIVDYLQLMRGGKGAQSREQEIAEISRELKNLARELRVAVIALAQLNRGVESRPDKRPMLSDLRESGSVEQDADVVLFLYRDEYYNRETTSDKGIAELIVAKQRNGPTGTVRTRFISSCTKFENLAPGEMEAFDEFGG